MHMENFGVRLPSAALDAAALCGDRAAHGAKGASRHESARGLAHSKTQAHFIDNVCVGTLPSALEFGNQGREAGLGVAE